jgi:hypothetical protein
MKGALGLFVALAFCGIAWGYTPKGDRAAVKALLRKNLMAVLFALAVVAVALFFAINTTVRFV